MGDTRYKHKMETHIADINYDKKCLPKFPNYQPNNIELIGNSELDQVNPPSPL